MHIKGILNIKNICKNIQAKVSTMLPKRHMNGPYQDEQIW